MSSITKRTICTVMAHYKRGGASLTKTKTLHSSDRYFGIGMRRRNLYLGAIGRVISRKITASCCLGSSKSWTSLMQLQQWRQRFACRGLCARSFSKLLRHSENRSQFAMPHGIVLCPLLAQSGQTELHCTCPLSGVKRTSPDARMPCDELIGGSDDSSASHCRVLGLRAFVLAKSTLMNTLVYGLSIFCRPAEEQ